MPDVPHFGMNAGCMVNQISWSMQRSGLITATVGLIGQGETIATATAAGALNSLELSRFGAFHGSIKREGARLGNVVSAQITYANNLDRIETIRADGRIDGADPSLASLTGTIEVRFADQCCSIRRWPAIRPSSSSGTRPAPDLSFTLTAHAVYLPKPRLALQGPGGVQASFAWQAAQRHRPRPHGDRHPRQ